MPITSIATLVASTDSSIRPAIDSKVVFKAINQGGAELDVYSSADHELKHSAYDLTKIPVLEVCDSSPRNELKEHLRTTSCEVKPALTSKANGDCTKAAIKKASSAVLGSPNPTIQNVIFVSLATLRGKTPAVQEDLIREFGRKLYGKLREFGVTQFVLPKNFEGEKAPDPIKPHFPLWMMQGFMEAAMQDSSSAPPIEVFCADSRFNEGVLQQAVTYGASKKSAGVSAPVVGAVSSAPSAALSGPSSADVPHSAPVHVSAPVSVDAGSADTPPSLTLAQRMAALAGKGGLFGSAPPSSSGSTPASAVSTPASRGRIVIPSGIGGLFGGSASAPGSINPLVAPVSGAPGDLDGRIIDVIVQDYAEYLASFAENTSAVVDQKLSDNAPLVISVDHYSDSRASTDDIIRVLKGRGKIFPRGKQIFVLTNDGTVNGGHWEFDVINIDDNDLPVRGRHVATSGTGLACGAHCVTKLLRRIPNPARSTTVSGIVRSFTADEQAEIDRFIRGLDDELRPELARKFMATAAWNAMRGAAGRELSENDKRRIYYDILQNGNQMEYTSMSYALTGLGINAVNAGVLLNVRPLAAGEYLAEHNLQNVHAVPEFTARVAVIAASKGVIAPRFLSRCAELSIMAPAPTSASAPAHASARIAPSASASAPAHASASLAGHPSASVPAIPSISAAARSVAASSAPAKGNPGKVTGYSRAADGKLTMTVLAPNGARRDVEIASQFVKAGHLPNTTVLDMKAIMKETAKLNPKTPSASPSLTDAWNLLTFIRGQEIDTTNAARGKTR